MNIRQIFWFGFCFILWLLTVTSYMVFAQEPENVWHATCTDTENRISAPSEIVRASACKKNIVSAHIPLSRMDGKTLAATELKACTFYLNGEPAKMVEPSPIITYTHPADTSTRCIPPVVPPVDPPEPPQPAPAVPMNPTATAVAGGYRIDCLLPAGAVQVRMLVVQPNGALGARVGTAKACGFVYAGYKPTVRYILKSANAKGVLSGRSDYVVTK